MTRRSRILGVLGVVAIVFAIGKSVYRDPSTSLLTLGPFVTDRAFYDAAFSALTPAPTPDGSLTGVLVSHHLVAASLMARAIGVAATQEPVTVVLISPDHFSRGAAPMTTVTARWLTPYVVLEPDMTGVATLAGGIYIQEQSNPFTTEHGILSITPFIAWAMPHARIVPLIIKDAAPAAAVREASALIGRLPGRVVLIGSFDFTHDATMAQAEDNDQRSLPIVAALDEGRVDQVVVDSHAGLATFLAAVKARQGSHFTLLDSTNSARLTGHHNQTDVTSYLIGYFTER